MADERELQMARDQALAKRMTRGDPRAVNEFCQAYLPRLYRFARYRLPSTEDAEDVVQIVLSSAARHIGSYRGDATLYTWLIAIGRREISKHLRGTARERASLRSDVAPDVATLIDELQAPQDDEPHAMAQRRQLIGRVHECLDQLSDLQAEALELKYVEGYSSKEIAGRFGISDEAAQSLLARARRAFREVCDGGIVNEATENGAP